MAERELKFSTEVLVKAEYKGNVVEFYQRAYLGSMDVTNNFRVIPGIKTKDFIAGINIDSMLKEANCDLTTVGNSIAAVEIDVVTMTAATKLCQFTIEKSFFAEKMAKGAGSGTWQEPEFLSHLWDVAAKKINEELELQRWQGIKGGTFPAKLAFLSLVDGYIEKCKDAEVGVTATANGTGTAATFRVNVDSDGVIRKVDVLTAGAYSVAPTTLTLANVGEGKGATFTIQTTGSSPSITVTGVTVQTGGVGYNQRVIAVTGTTITAVNVIAEMTKMFNALTPELRAARADLKWHISAHMADMYRLATASGNTANYITQALNLSFLDIPLVVSQGIPNGYSWITRKDNMIYTLDGESDGASLELIDLSKTTGERRLLASTVVRAGFHLSNESEIVYYRP